MSDPSDLERLNKAQRLALAAAIAPALRTASEKTKSRKVKLYDKETGEITGYSTLDEVQKKLLLDRQIEMEVGEGVRPKEVVCRNCGRMLKVTEGRGAVPIVCKEPCVQKMCAEPGCERRPPSGAFTPAVVTRRAGLPWMCKSHGIQRADKARKEQRRRKNRKPLTKAQKNNMKDAQRRVWSSMSKEDRVARTSAMRASQSKEQHIKAAQWMNANATIEKRRAALSKGWATRRANKAKQDSNPDTPHDSQEAAE